MQVGLIAVYSSVAHLTSTVVDAVHLGVQLIRGCTHHLKLRTVRGRITSKQSYEYTAWSQLSILLVIARSQSLVQ